MRKLGCVAAELSGNTVTENMELIKKVGFYATSVFYKDTSKYIDIEEWTEKSEELNLKIESVHAPYNDVNSIWQIGDEGDDYTEKIRGIIKQAAKCSIPTVILHSAAGTVPPKTSAIGLLRFKKLIIESEKCGVKLAIENKEIVRHLGLLMDYFKDSNIGFCYNCGHERCFTPGFRFMPLFGERTLCVNLNDNFGLAKSKDVNYRDDLHQIPFDGNSDFIKICGYIKESGFKGTLMIDASIRSSHDFYSGLSAEDFYKKAYEAALKLRRLIDGK